MSHDQISADLQTENRRLSAQNAELVKLVADAFTEGVLKKEKYPDNFIKFGGSASHKRLEALLAALSPSP